MLKKNMAVFILILMTVFLSAFGQDASAAARRPKEVFPKKNKLVEVNTLKRWSLEDSVKRTLAVSPRIRSKEAEVMARKGDLLQSGAWPNPDVEVGGSDKLGIDDGSGGVDLTQISVSQPISLGRVGRQRKLTRAKFQASQQNLIFQQLLQEAETAQRFHTLQLISAKLKQAEEQLAFAQRYQKEGDGNAQEKTDRLVRYLTPLEQKRLDIMRAVAGQLVASTEGEYSEALSGFAALLQLSETDSRESEELKPVEFQQSLDELLTLQGKNHPAIISAKLEEEAANAGIKLARGELLPDPVVKFFGERDFLNDSRETFYGASINFKFPLWDRKKGSVTKAKSEAEKVKYDLQSVKLDLETKLKQKHLHLSRLVEQAAHYRTEILGPAEEVFELTKNAFAAGEVNVLSIIDANKTYFDARSHYLEHLHEAWLELAELRLAAGLSLVASQDFEGVNSKGGQS